MSDVRPRVFVKTGCPWCAQARETLNRLGIAYEEIVVTDNPSAMEEMVKLSGQSKAPTMDWEGDILADFGDEELLPFLQSKGIST